MSRWLTYIKFGSYAAVFYVLISGCTMNHVNTNPEELFHRTLTRMSNIQYDIQWEDPGSIINQHPMDMNWNPLEHIERYQNSSATAIIEEELTDHRFIVLSVVLDQDSAKQVLLDQLHNQMTAIRTQLPLVQKSVEQQLSLAEKTMMSDEIKAFIELADQQLIAKLETSQVQVTMQLWVYRGTEIPFRIKFDTTVDFVDTDQPQTEVISDSFLINGVE